MVTAVSSGIKISVHTFYRPDYSDAGRQRYLFTYRITMENQNAYPVKLMRRHWLIFDSLGPGREVEGEGVVGEQPELHLGEVYEYESACNLTSEIGFMEGTYLFHRLEDGTSFSVEIPRFDLIVPTRKN